MTIRFGAAYESYKLMAGSKWFFSPKKIDEFPRNMTLHTGRNDRAAFQVILSADEDYALNVGCQAWFSQSGQRLNVRLAAEFPFEATMNLVDMHMDDDGYLKADALLTQTVKEYPKDACRAVYAEVAIPEDAAAGSYAGTVKVYANKMFEDEQLIGQIDIAIEVADYVIPSGKDSPFYLDLWQHSSNIARKHEVTLWSDEHFAVLEGYVKSLADLGQKAATLVVTEIPWSGQSCFNEERMAGNLFEYSIVEITKKADGTFAYDFSHMQRYIDLCRKYGIDSEISLYGLANIWQNEDFGYTKIAPDYPDNLRVRYFDEATRSYRYMRCAKEIDAYIKALEQYFLTTGQMEKVRLAADEPGNMDAYRASLEHLMQVAPSFKFKAAINHAEFIPAFGKEVYDFVPFLMGLSAEYDKIMEYKATMPGKRFLWYVCCSPDYPNTFLRSKLEESYFIGVLTSYAGLDGFLRWNYTVWNDDPRGDIRYGTFAAGDTNFVYPAANGAPLLTLRYKALQRGIQLFTLLEKLKENSQTEALEKAYALVVREKDIRAYAAKKPALEEMCSLNYEDYDQMKWEVLQALSK